MGLARAVSPWIFLLLFATLVNLKALPFFHLLFEKLPMAVPIIPGAPRRRAFLWQAYTWVFVSTSGRRDLPATHGRGVAGDSARTRRSARRGRCSRRRSTSPSPS